jgi:hypothetical protein
MTSGCSEVPHTTSMTAGDPVAAVDCSSYDSRIPFTLVLLVYDRNSHPIAADRVMRQTAFSTKGPMTIRPNIEG